MFGKRTILVFMSLVALSTAINPDNICALLKNTAKIVDDTNCAGFYTCNNGKATAGTCPSGYYFNKDTQGCVTKAQATCVSSDDAPCAGVADGQFVSMSGSCSGYYYCKNQLASAGECPNNLNFNPKTQSCQYSTEYACVIPGSGAASDVTNDDPQVLCAYVQDGLYFGNAASCSTWHKCQNGVLKTGACTGFVFNVQNQECVYESTYNCQQLKGDPTQTGGTPLGPCKEDKPICKTNNYEGCPPGVRPVCYVGKTEGCPEGVTPVCKTKGDSGCPPGVVPICTVTNNSGCVDSTKCVEDVDTSGCDQPCDSNVTGSCPECTIEDNSGCPLETDPVCNKEVKTGCVANVDPVCTFADKRGCTPGVEPVCTVAEPSGCRDPATCVQGDETGCEVPVVPIVPKYQDPDNCNSYLTCVNEKYVRTKCPAGQYFSVPEETCKPRLDAINKCDRCQDTSQTFVQAYDDDCKGYMYCVNGKKSGGGVCANGNYFNEKIGSCTSAAITYPVCLKDSYKTL